MNGGNSNKVILSANPGSQSRKYALYRGGQLLVSMHFETEKSSKLVNIVVPGDSSRQKVTTQEYKQPLSFFLIWAISNDIIKNDSEIDAAGLRIVSPGTYFQKNRVLDQNFLDKLAAQQNKAPIHITAALREAKDLMKSLPHSLLIAVSDSTFHDSMNVNAREYAIAIADTNKLDIHRFGYHGISYQSVMRRLNALAGSEHGKVIICHLGGGSSIAAIESGQSFDSSTGYAPLEGLPMMTRSGDIGIDAVFELMNEKNLSQPQILNYLNTQSGLKGMSGTDGDIRKLLDLYSQSHKGSMKALEHFAYSIKKSIGSYIAAMNGLDILVFTGTAGFRSAQLRKLICSDLDSLGIHLDSRKNSSLKDNGFVNKHGETGIAVIETDEMSEIVYQVTELQ